MLHEVKNNSFLILYYRRPQTQFFTDFFHRNGCIFHLSGTRSLLYHRVMGDYFFKALKWAIFVSLIIMGIAILNWVEQGDIRPIILAVFSLGGAYILSGPWRRLPPIPMIISIVLVLALGLLADN